MRYKFYNLNDCLDFIKSGKAQKADTLMELSFESEQDLKTTIYALFQKTASKNPDSACNILCHNINENKVENVANVGENILTDGLKCNYSTIFRTLTYTNYDSISINEYGVDKIVKYSYVTDRYNDRTTVIATIPKYIKDGDNKINFSTPEMSKMQKDWTNEPYIEYDKIKQEYIDPRFMLCKIDINEVKKEYKLLINSNNYLLLSAKQKEQVKQQYLTKLKNLSRDLI